MSKSIWWFIFKLWLRLIPFPIQRICLEYSGMSRPPPPPSRCRTGVTTCLWTGRRWRARWGWRWTSPTATWAPSWRWTCGSRACRSRSRCRTQSSARSRAGGCPFRPAARGAFVWCVGSFLPAHHGFELELDAPSVHQKSPHTERSTKKKEKKVLDLGLSVL